MHEREDQELDVEKVVSFLHSLPFFHNFNDEQLKILVEYLSYQEFEGAETIFQQGKQSEKFYIIDQGSVEISVRKPGDVKRIIQILGIGSLFGEIALISQRSNTETACAEEKTRCLVLSAKKLQLLWFANPILASELERAIALSASQRIEKILAIASHMHATLELIRGDSTQHCSLPWFVPRKEATCEVIENYPFHLPTLRLFDIFSEFNDDELVEFLSFGVVKHLESGYAYQRDPINVHGVSIILSGTLQVYTSVMPKLSIVEPGQMHGELSVIRPDKELLLAVAREDSVIVFFYQSVLEELFVKNHELWLKLYHIICIQVVMFLYDVDRQLLRLEAETEYL